MQPGYGQDTDLTYRRPDYGYYWGEILYNSYSRLLVQEANKNIILKNIFPRSEPDPA